MSAYEQVDTLSILAQQHFERHMLSMGNRNDDDPRANLMINYIDTAVPEDELRSMFEQFGPIVSFKMCVEPHTGLRRGFGFVKYADAGDAAKAVAGMHGRKVGLKVLRVGIAQPEGTFSNLYVAGLPKRWGVEEMRKIFGVAGRILEVSLLCAEDGQSRGAGFVRYQNRKQAQLAISAFHGASLMGSDPLTVRFAEHQIRGHHNKAATQRSLKQVVRVVYGQSLSPTSRSSPAPSPSSSSNASSSPSIWSSPSSLPSLHQRMSSLSLSETGGERSSSYDFLEEGVSHSPSPTDCGAPSFSSQGSLFTSNLVSSQQRSNGGGIILPNSNSNGSSVASKYMTTKPIPIPASSSSSSSSSSFSPLSPTASSPSSSSAQMQPRHACSTLFVYNLPHDTVDTTLYDIFSPYCAVRGVKTMVDFRTGQCKGYGFVQLDTCEEAERAVLALNGAVFGGRKLQVSIKKEKKRGDRFAVRTGPVGEPRRMEASALYRRGGYQQELRV